MNNFVLGFIAALTLSLACNKSTSVGNELILDEDIALGFTDTLSIKAKTVKSDPVPTYFNNNFVNNTFLLGELDDPVFGKSKSSIYFDIQRSGFASFSDGILDSMVFVFAYQEDSFYGDSTETHDISIWRLSEKLDNQDTIYSDQQFELFGGAITNPVASVEGFVPNRTDSVIIDSYITGEEIKVIPQMRIRINDRFAQTLFNDSLSNSTDAALQDFVNGFLITSTPQNGNSMIGLNMLEFNQTTGIDVYYQNDLGAKTIFRYSFNERRPQNFESDLTGSVVEPLIDQDITNGDPLFVQGMNGVVTELDFSSIKSFDNELLNLAELQVFLYEGLANDNMSLYPAARSLALTNANTGREIDDLLFAKTNRFIDLLFGGTLQDSVGISVKSYTMNMTSYLKDVQDGIEDGKLHLEILDKIESPRRTIIYGPGHPTFAPKLKLTFTLP